MTRTKSKADKDGPDAKAADSPGSDRSLDAVALLEEDHRAVDDLFAQFDGSENPAEKRAIANAICMMLKVHARVEEDLFYPAVMAATGESALLQEALVEHAGARDLITQIESGFPGEPLFDARVTVLGEYVRHHVREEEGEMFPLARKSDLDLDALGQQMLLRKQALMTGMVVSNPIAVLC